MTKNEINKTITGFLELIWKGKESTQENEQTLILSLDKLALAYHYADYEVDSVEYLNPPDKDYLSVRKIVCERFPDFGYYNLPMEFTTKIAGSEIVVGDAIDDITDIATDLWEIEWRWKHNNELDALWHFRFGYYSHWGNHLRCLQLYLFQRHHERA